MDLDCAIIVSAKRVDLVRSQILPSVLGQGVFNEVFVVGDYEVGEGYRYLPVPPLTGTTLDALVKRDCATVASRADAILFLSDDHRLEPGWNWGWNEWREMAWDVLVPARFTIHDGATVEVNNGMDGRWPGAPYCAGHAGIYMRDALHDFPWTSSPHDPFWDLHHSKHMLAAGSWFLHCPDLKVLDIDPNPAEKPRHFRWGVSGETTSTTVD